MALNGEVVLAFPTSHGGHFMDRIAAIEEVVGGNSACVEKHARGMPRPPEADAAVGTVGCDQAVVEGMLGRMPRPLEAGVAMGIDHEFYDRGGAVGCSSVGCEEVFRRKRYWNSWRNVRIVGWILL